MTSAPSPTVKIVASELKDPTCHSNECQIGSFSSEATRYPKIYRNTVFANLKALLAI